MEKNIVISSLNNLAAILHDNYLYEFIINDSTYQVGNIYIGTIARIFPTIKAVFVGIQINKKYKNGFNHANDLLLLRNKKNVPSLSVIVLKQKLCVQVIKEAFFDKNPRLTVNVSIPGRYVIFSPLNKIVCISRRILHNNEKEYLKSLALLIRPLSFGGIFFRNNAIQVSTDVILEEWEILKFRWKLIIKIMNQNLKLQSFLLYQDSNISKKIIRDFYHLQISSIFVDLPQALKKIRFYLEYWSCLTLNPNLKLLVVSKQLLERFKIHSAIAQAYSFRVELLPAGYIFIETFEALTIIDVNSGIFDKQKHPIGLVLILNCSAAKEIAYQIKTRNISGVIVIDFIDMISKKDQLELLRYLHKLFKYDYAQTQVVQFSELGLVEVTRKRTGKSILELIINSYPNFSKVYSAMCRIKVIDPTKFLSEKSSYLTARLSLIKTYSSAYFEQRTFTPDVKVIQCTKETYVLNYIMRQKKMKINVL